MCKYVQIRTEFILYHNVVRRALTAGPKFMGCPYDFDNVNTQIDLKFDRVIVR